MRIPIFRIFLFLSLIGSIFLFTSCATTGLHRAQKTPRKLKAQLMEVKNDFHGDMGISLHNLKTGDKIEINADAEFPTASTIKTAIMCEAFQQLSEGKLRYYETRVYSTTMRKGGSGFIQNYKDGTRIELKEAIHFMIHASDNVATNLVIDFVGGFEPINRWLINHGFQVTRSLTYIGGGTKWDPDLAKEWGIGVTTPREMRRLLEMIRLNEAGTPAACDEMMRVLSHQYWDADIPSQVPPYVHVSNKTGALSDLRADNAIVDAPTGTYILSVYTNNNKDRRWVEDNEADRVIRKISSLVWKYYNPHSKWSVPQGVENYW